MEIADASLDASQCDDRSNCSSMSVSVSGLVSWNFSDAGRNGTLIGRPMIDVTVENVALALLLFTFCAATVFGNILVIVAVVRERYLHTVTNYFITSLAVADCLVGSIVMTFSAAYELLNRQWIFGQDVCDIWHSFDVLASTASILNLCIISMDRYWAITDPFTYPSRMTPKRACCFIALVWICSSLISFPAIGWWRAVADPSPSANQCVFTDDVGYLVFSSTISFFAPLFVMVFTYCRIYRAAVAQSRSLRSGIKQVASDGQGDVELTLRIHRGGCVASNSRRCAAAAVALMTTSLNGDQLDTHRSAVGAASIKSRSNAAISPSAGVATAVAAATAAAGRVPITKVNFSLSRKLAKIAKERKAAKTLGIVMGVFIACWLPFFVTNLLSGFCLQCIHDPERVLIVVNWLGWLNSGMNPVIYACWSRDFRR